MGFPKLNEETGIDALNSCLATRSYIEFYSLSQADISCYRALESAPSAAQYPHAARWYNHIASHEPVFSDIPGDTSKTYQDYGPELIERPSFGPSENDDNDVDLFGSDNEDDAEAARIREQRLADYKMRKAAKPKAIAKSVLILDVKPWDDQTDMVALEVAVRGIQRDGLVWGTSKLIAIGYGITKLQVNLVVEDDKISTQDIQDEIESFEKYVQSSDVVGFVSVHVSTSTKLTDIEAKLPILINYSTLRINTTSDYQPCASSFDAKMTSIGTGYDLLNSIYSPDGHNFQVDYAVKASENGGTSIGIRCNEGVVLALEKVAVSKLSKPGANKRIGSVDGHIGVVCSGLIPDGSSLVERARDESHSWRQTFKAPIPTTDLASRLGNHMQVFTMSSSLRPFGVMAIIGGVDTSEEIGVDGEVGSGPACGAGGKVTGKKHGGTFLYMAEPSGQCLGYWGTAAGRGRQTAKAELEKLDLEGGDKMTLLQAVKEAVRIIYVAQKDSKEKGIELELTWISTVDGPTKGRHVEVPKELREEAERLAAKAEDESYDDDEDTNKKDDDDKMEE
ncbi:Proteasome component C1 [Cordyceps militaris]|uniref:Proteasome component C1 n=1 Tax=Cordyceps militaris TaxID=73501 RepID=A0A2H4SH69_CORMI|nr:Proteasome component C1 [Cordyceps militaris]